MIITITGSTGYLGRSLLEHALCNGFNVYTVNRLSSKSSMSYQEYFEAKHCSDVIIHCGALVHNKTSSYADFYQSNVVLTKQLAIHAKNQKCKKFIFISSIGVFGNTKSSVHKNSNCKPYDFYTRSKYEAELELFKIFSNSFTELVIIRPPIIVGKYAPGNVRIIESLLKVLPVTPFLLVKNKKSIVSINNLCEFLLDFDNLSKGIHIPVDPLPLSTAEIFDLIASFHFKKFYHLPIPVFLLKIFFRVFRLKGLERNLIFDLVVKQD